MKGFFVLRRVPHNLALFLLSIGVSVFFAACEEPASHTTVEAPAEIREKACAIAEFYIGMEYDWGGQSHWSEKGVDLVLMVPSLPVF